MGPSTAAMPLSVSAAGLGPVGQVVDRAEAVLDPVLVAVAHQGEPLAVGRRAALRTGVRGLQLLRLLLRVWVEARSLNRPGHHVLQAAEHGGGLPGALVQAPALLAVHRAI